MSERDHRPPPTLEELLRLKRAERPTLEFWSNFERELRQKQLAALVHKEPWWRGLPRRLLRPAAYLPVGATAILALSFVSLRHYSPVPAERADAPPAPAVAGGDAAQIRPPVTATGGGVGPAAVSAPAADAVRFDDRISVAKTNASPGVVPATTLLPWNAPEPAGAVDSPSARFIAANLERLEQTDPELLNGLLTVGRPVAPARSSRTSSHAIDLANVAGNMARHSRLIPIDATTRSYAREPMAPDLVRERNARRLAESEMSDQASRLKVKGDRLSFRL